MNHRLVEGAVEENLKRVSSPAKIERFPPFRLHRVPLRPGCVGRSQVRVEHLSEAL